MEGRWENDKKRQMIRRMERFNKGKTEGGQTGVSDEQTDCGTFQTIDRKTEGRRDGAADERRTKETEPQKGKGT